MKGTEKQIKWAEDIRAGYISGIEHLDSHGENRYVFEEDLLCRAFGRNVFEARMEAATADIPRRNPDGTRARNHAALSAAKQAEKDKMLEELKEIIATEESASWWIDHR